jgi:hypothetical protein
VEQSSRSASPDVPSLDDDWAGGRGRAPSPEQRLLVAIVRRAVWDFVLYRDMDAAQDEERYALAVDAAGWLFWDGEEEIDMDGRYTFHYICSLLDLNVRHVRKSVLKLSRNDIQRLNNHIKDD